MPFVFTAFYILFVASSYRRAGSRFYWVSYLGPDGRRVAKSSGIPVDDPGSAKRIRAYVAALVEQERGLVVEVGAEFRAWVRAFLERKHRQQAKTLRRYLNAWAHWELFFSQRKIRHPNQVTYSLVHDYMAWRTNPVLAAEQQRRCGRWNSAIFDVKVLSSTMQEAVRRGFVLANPCVRLGIKREPVKEKPEITKEQELEILRLLAAKPQARWMHDAFMVAMRQGCRLMECRVPLESIDLQAGTVVFQTKGARVHVMPLHRDLRGMVEEALAQGRRVLVDVPPQASVRFQEFFAEAGFPDLTFHCTRVTVVTRLCRAGFSESQTMAYVGHSSVLVHRIYKRLRAPDVRHLGDALS